MGLIAAALSGGGCDGPTAAERAAEDARDIAMVEAAQERRPPLRPIVPQPITIADIERLELFGTSCAFQPDGASEEVLLAFDDRAVVLLEGNPILLASDSGGPPGPLGTWQHYVGKGLSLRLVKGAGDGVQTGYEAMEWSGKLVMRDEHDRIVYSRGGKLHCGS